MAETKGLTVTIHVMDIEPVRSIMDIVSDMIEDDRVPMEYRRKIWDVLKDQLT